MIIAGIIFGSIVLLVIIAMVTRKAARTAASSASRKRTSRPKTPKTRPLAHHTSEKTKGSDKRSPSCVC